MTTPQRRRNGRPPSQGASLSRAAILAVALTVAGTAGAQVRIPFPPVDTLVERPSGWQPVPPTKPSVAASFAGTKSFAGRTCLTADPEAKFRALPPALRTLSNREMLGQLLVVSFSGKTVDDAGVRATARAIARSDIGGVLYFRHNVGTAEDVRAVNHLFQSANPFLPAMIAVDQEGGTVMRIKPSEGAPSTPSAETIAAGSLSAALDAYGDMADALADLGFTVNFGPVVDLLVNEDNPVIARFGRSYGADPDKVRRYANTFIRAHHDAGIATALKHFPGHGSSTADSHERAINLDPTWSRTELIPFRDLIDDRAASMVMVGHLERQGLSGPGGLPASLSPIAIREFLRETLCFDGIVVSDDLAMQAVSSSWDAAEAVQLMIEAGGDIALLSLAGDPIAGVERILDTLAARADEDPPFADQVRHAFARVVTQKLEMADLRAAARKSRMGDASHVVAQAK